jgi:hypothetical protein
MWEIARFVQAGLLGGWSGHMAADQPERLADGELVMELFRWILGRPQRGW